MPFLSPNLGCHIALRAQDIVERLPVLGKESGEAKICQFDPDLIRVVLRIARVGLLTEHVVWLQITVGDLNS